MKIIVKKSDNGIRIAIPNANKYGDGKRPYSECKFLQPGDEWFLYDGVIEKSDLESRKQLYWENDEQGNPQIKKDLSWEKRLMPDQLIKRKHLDRIRADLDVELIKQTPDAVKVVKLQRDMDKYKEIKAGRHNEDPVWTEIALQNLDKRVEKGESDKPLIRQKLQAKLTELNNK